MSEAHIVLHEVGNRNHGLDHLVHQQKLLGVLQVSFRQVDVGAWVNGATLWRWGNQKEESLTDYNIKAEVFEIVSYINKLPRLWQVVHA